MMNNQSQATFGSDSDHAFVARTTNVKHIIRTIKAINFGDRSLFTINEKGIKLSVDLANTIQARAFFPRENFINYKLNPAEDDEGEVEFSLDLDLLLNCLSIFGSGDTTAVRFAYEGYGSPLSLILEDDGVITDCTIKTVEMLDFTLLSVTEVDVPSNVIMHSAWLMGVFNEIDSSSEYVDFYISPDQPYFKLTTSGDAGSSQVTCPKSSDVIESFTCEQTCTARFRTKTIKHSQKPLEESVKVSVRINVDGMISLQYMICPEEMETIYVEFVVSWLSCAQSCTTCVLSIDGVNRRCARRTVDGLMRTD
eukprot:TRINITY_DN11759_c0_g2_i2.p1 TRINITY_DN11759_c0_g2~~TRINITY_DN11759_c0_g2_i2.p1  ORF type:complete len:309 (+),score=49.88 TRINITY_DN11759_c0_g2_i2:239-1165(+)